MKKKISVTMTFTSTLDGPDTKYLAEVLARQLRNTGAEDNGARITLSTNCDSSEKPFKIYYKTDDGNLSDKEFTFGSLSEFLRKYCEFICHYDTLMLLRDYFSFNTIQCSEEEIKEEPEAKEDEPEE